MIRFLSIVRELAMIMLKRFWLFCNGVFKMGYAGRIIDKTNMYEAASRGCRMAGLYGYCISILYDGTWSNNQFGIFQVHDLR
jgi:hypothetical protein